MQRDVQILERAVENGAYGCTMCLDRKSGCHRALSASIVVEGAVGSDDELLPDLEGLVLDDGRLPDSEAGWVPVPLFVRLRRITNLDEL